MPEDLKVVAYDGMDITRLCYPQVTSIDQNIRFLADTCASTVIKLIDGSERVPHKQIMSVEVHQGEDYKSCCSGRKLLIVQYIQKKEW